MYRFADLDDQLGLPLNRCCSDSLDPLRCMLASMSRVRMLSEVRTPMLEVFDLCAEIENMYG